MRVTKVLVGVLGLLIAAAPPTVALERVLVDGPNAAAAASAVLVGSGIAEGYAVSKPADFGADGRFVWKKSREITDQFGIRHVFYQQSLVGAKVLANAAAASVQTEIPVYVAEIGLHFDAQGNLLWVLGYQASSPAGIPAPLYNTTESATQAARAAIVARGAFEPAGPMETPSLTASAWLMLWDRPERGGLRPVWVVPLAATTGEVYSVGVDAVDGDIVHVGSSGPNGACSPATGTASMGTAATQLDVTHTRPVAAVPTASWVNPYKAGFTFDPRWPGQAGSRPDIEVYRGFWSGSYTNNSCVQYSTKVNWGTAPVYGISGAPVYLDSNSAYTYVEPNTTERPLLNPRRIGDALHFTYLIFQTLKSKFAWEGFSHSDSVGRIVLSESDGGSGWFALVPSNPCPGTAQAGYPAADTVTMLYNLSQSRGYEACLDAIAHEWGHGCVKYGADFGGFGTCNSQNPCICQGWDEHSPFAPFHEGFADVIAHIVEHANPAWAPGGVADWTIGTVCWDALSQRPAASYAANTPLCYWKGAVPSGGSYPCPSTSYDAHADGHMLSVAFRLLRDGCSNANGCNPACGINSQAPCSVTQITAQGSLADALFFSTMMSSPQGSTWCDVRYTAVKVAGIFGNVVAQQMQNAFSAIGYFPSTACQ